MTKIAVVWFRKSLRLHDNPALQEAIRYADKHQCQLVPLFCLDPHFTRANLTSIGRLRWQHLVETLECLSEQLQRIGSDLFVLRANPELAFQRLIDADLLEAVFFEMDTEPYATMRDEKITKLCIENRVHVESKLGHTLFDPAHVLALSSSGRAPLQYRSFLNIIERIPVDAALSAPSTIPPVDAVKAELIKSPLLKEFHSPRSLNGQPFALPTIQEIYNDDSIEVPALIHGGGELVALRRMREYLSDKEKTAHFEKPQTSPAAFDPPSTTVLSPYFKFGSLSCRLFYHELKNVLRQVRNHSQPPFSLLGQLYWREFYYTASYGNSNFHRIDGNPICLKVDWLPIGSATELRLFEAWRDARTGYPWIDAIMIQLRNEGWIHHLARHSVACFLTRGDLYCSWERGVQVFEELLLDADYALNAGNWMWLSASQFYHQYFRVYSPVVFGQKYDKSGKYIRKYLPILAKMPDQYIYEPWKAPPEVQRKAGCIVGQDYPGPIVDHDEARKQCMTRMASAYKRGIYGDGNLKKSKQVEDKDLDGDGPAVPTTTSSAASGKRRKQQPTLDAFVAKKRK